MFSGGIETDQSYKMSYLYGWGSTASRLEPLRGDSFFFTTKSAENSLNF